MKPAPKTARRPNEIFQQFLTAVDRHVADIVAGRTEQMYHIKDFAAELCIHPTHLSNSIKKSTGRSACFYFEVRIMTEAKRLLQETSQTISQIAGLLTFDPSNFTKFFKRFEGQTPSAYRQRCSPVGRPSSPIYRLLPTYKSKRTGQSGTIHPVRRSLLFFNHVPDTFSG